MPKLSLQDIDPSLKEGIHVFGSNYSNNVARVLLMLEEKGLPYTKHSVNLLKTENLLAPYLRIHPSGTVPAMVHECLAISNSNEILRYIEDRFPDPSLLPANLELIEEMWDLVDQAAECHLPAIKAQFYAYGLGRPCSKKDLEQYKIHNKELYDFHWQYLSGMTERQKAEIKEKNITLLTHLETRLEAHRFLVCSKYTVADVAWVTNVIFLQRMGFDVSSFKKVYAWVKRIEKRASVNARSKIPKIPRWLLRIIIKTTRWLAMAR